MFLIPGFSSGVERLLGWGQKSERETRKEAMRPTANRFGTNVFFINLDKGISAGLPQRSRKISVSIR
jgi:hypothetical protein